MMTLDWTSSKDRDAPSPGQRPRRTYAVAPPYAGQGVRDALRNAYRKPCDDLPTDLRALLAKLM